MSYAQGGGRIQAVRNGVHTNSPLKRERNPFVYCVAALYLIWGCDSGVGGLLHSLGAPMKQLLFVVERDLDSHRGCGHQPRSKRNFFAFPPIPTPQNSHSDVPL